MREMTLLGPVCSFSPMAKLKPKKPDKAGVAERIRKVRDGYSMDQGEFAEKTGVADNTYNQWEKGKRIPDLPLAMALCDAWGITLDYLYRGQFQGLSEAAFARVTGVRPLTTEVPKVVIKRARLKPTG